MRHAHPRAASPMLTDELQCLRGGFIPAETLLQNNTQTLKLTTPATTLISGRMKPLLPWGVFRLAMLTL